jgi:nucleoside-diphosphate-sugar epimerase
MRAVVTGAAGFVGSHLCELLIDKGDEVVGIDSLTDYYRREIKLKNLSASLESSQFTFLEGGVHELDLVGSLTGADVIFHLAGQPGVRASWGANFGPYIRDNIEATQGLLEAARGLPLQKFVYASSSSVYGNAETYPTPETVRPAPVSPYGVTKLAAEHLCELYRGAYEVPTASLRLFTVYGPRQRPDMAFSRLVDCALLQKPFQLYGDGSQTRDFTFVADVVAAMRNAAISDWCGVANIGGGDRKSLAEVIGIVEDLIGPVDVVRGPRIEGDVAHTGADTSLATTAFGFAPMTTLVEGLKHMIEARRNGN